jgi:nitroreductase
MSLQQCLASRKDCSGEGRILSKAQILDICKSTNQVVPSKSLFVVLPDGKDYLGGIYLYKDNLLTLITDKEKTQYSLELYPELIWKESIPLNELIQVGLMWQYLSLKVENMGLGVSQRARAPKKYNKLVNNELDQKYNFLYSVAVRERDRTGLLEDILEPLQIEVKEGTILLGTPSCYEDRKLYKNQYQGIPLETAIFNQVEKRAPNHTTLHEISQLLWACQGETDHATHGNRDALEKNGYGRVHASGCAGYAVYPIVIVENLANLPKGFYIYNPIGFSALNRWVKIDNKIAYDHSLHHFTSDRFKVEIEEEFGVNLSNYAILLCIDRKKPCAGFMHKIMNLKYWAEIEAGMALAGLQLQANALGLNWQKAVFSNPDDSKYRHIFNLDSVERLINNMAINLINPPKNEKLSLKGELVPTVLFSLQS